MLDVACAEVAGVGRRHFRELTDVRHDLGGHGHELLHIVGRLHDERCHDDLRLVIDGDLRIVALDECALVGTVGHDARFGVGEVAINVAEGAGEFATLEKARFYRIARRSATECAAILDVCRVRNLIEPAALSAGRDFLLRIVAMLTRMLLNCTDKTP